jgi:alpha-ketoglutarate-dependent taurine dioxygenase
VIQQFKGASVSPLWRNQSWGAVILPDGAASVLADWAQSHGQELVNLLNQRGAILLRGFAVPDMVALEAFADAISPDPAFYRERATPRSTIEGQVFTSTEYPKELRIYVHNENSHVTRWPRYLVFHCRTPPRTHGATPLADCRAVYNQLQQSIRDRFIEEGWLYRRTFNGRSAIPWRSAFAVSDKREMETYCAENFMEPEWRGDDLTLRYRRWAALNHPATGEQTWFNHGMFFNAYSLEPSIKEALKGLPESFYATNTYHGNGELIDESVLKDIDRAYAAETARFDWQEGDVLLLDNMLVAHGREAFSGNRDVVVTMRGDLACNDFLEATPFCSK